MHYFQAVSKNNYDHISDTELLEKFYQDNQTQWLGLLLQRYTLLLLGVCMKYLKNEEAAKDAVQQIFLKAIMELGKYKVTYFKSWLYRVARNHCLMQLRDKYRLVSVDDTVQIAAPDPVQPELAEKEITLNQLETSLEELNPEQKTCVTLFYLKKKSYQAITEETGFSLLQVKSYIQNGKRNLKLLLQKKLNHPE